MNDREKVITALSAALVQMHGCGRYTPEDVDELEKAAWDALKLLETKEPRVMTLNEMNDKRGRGEAVYYEYRDATCKSQDVFVIAPDKDLDVVWLKAETYTLAAKMSTMGKTWRCWTSRPDEKVRAKTPWADN